jgi:pantoate--beta-alanine ligase
LPEIKREMNSLMLKRCIRRLSTAARDLNVAESIAEMRMSRHEMKGTVGFVPTMGALHIGHLSLVDEALRENDNVVVSIFVNPTQFSAGEDLDKYPRTVAKDLSMLKAVGAKHVFLPNNTEMYKPNSLCRVEAPAFNNIYEGSKRPDFFRGVATVVCKLFNIVQPDVAYFGQKDISQFIMLRSMVDDLNMPVTVKACPTLREKDGLAMSSRNVYLTPEEREVASILVTALDAAAYVCTSRNQPVTAQEMRDAAMKVLSLQPMVSEVQYISIASPETMKELSTVTESEGAVISSAIKLGNVRLIDNILIGGARNRIYGNK